MESSLTGGRNQLIETLRACGQPFHLHATADGSELLLLCHGGRVLGLFAPGEDENFLWSNPALESPETARALFGSPGWQNAGGDRTWVAPEIDVFFPRFPDTSVHVCPASLDPGNYESRHGADAGTESPRLVNTLALTLSRSSVDVMLTIDKQWMTAPALIGDELLRTGGLTCAGYTQVATLTVNSASGPCAIGLWDVLQVPYGGECLVGTRGRARVKQYVGRTCERELSAGESATAYAPSTPGIHKLGFFATQLTGRIGYFHRAGERATLIVRQLTVQPSVAYADVPWQTPADIAGPGCAVQVCAVDHPVLGRYIELEHHSPALYCAGPAGVTDVSHLWALRGPEPEVRAALRRMFEPVVPAARKG